MKFLYFSLNRAAPAPSRNLPAQAAPAPAPMVAQPAQRQPGLFAQMATTAAGVAVGSAVGHTLSSAILGGGGSGNQQPAPQQEQAPIQQQYQPQQYQQQQQQQHNPCLQQLQQFLECSTTQADITLCQGFNDALKDCKLRYGV